MARLKLIRRFSARWLTTMKAFGSGAQVQGWEVVFAHCFRVRAHERVGNGKYKTLVVAQMTLSSFFSCTEYLQLLCGSEMFQD